MNHYWQIRQASKHYQRSSKIDTKTREVWSHFTTIPSSWCSTYYEHSKIGLGTNWNEELAEAWIRCSTTLSRAMISACEEEIV